MELGVPEANQNFSEAIKAVKAGEEVILTERGLPIAVIKPWPGGNDVEATLNRMAASGRLQRATKRGPMPTFKARRSKGPSLSQAISDERDER